MWKRLLRSVREYKKPTILTLVFIIGEAIIETFIPFITAEMVNRIKAGAEMSDIIQTGVTLAVMAVISLLFGGLAAYTCAKASAGFSKNLRHDIFRAVGRFSFANIDKFSSASLVTRMTTDINNAQMSYMMIIRTAIRCPLMLIFSVTMAYVMGGMLAACFVVTIPVLVIGLLLVAKFAMPAFRRVFKKYDRLNESIEENVRGMRVVKGFSRENYEKEKFDTASDDIRRDFTRAERIVACNAPLMQMCLYFTMIFVLLVGSYMAVSGKGATIDVGHISAMLTYGMQILMSLMMLSAIYVILTISAESVKRICEVLEEEPTIHNPENPITAVKDGSIRFDNVSFKYAAAAKHNTLSNIDLTIQSGMTVGIVGGTGTGKSSLVQLIPRLYDVTEGTLSVSGIDVRNYDLDTLRGAVAMVLQKNELFSGTIKENLRWGNENATDEELVEACKLAQAHDFVVSFPDGYDTKIEQGGTNVSGGQKQRLCIARALLKKPKILILDDSTSAVDTRTDALIRAGFKTYIPETTKIIIAQRISSVEDADLILVMDGGCVIASGKHEQLLATCDIYKEIYEQQTGVNTDKGGDAE